MGKTFTLKKDTFTRMCHDHKYKNVQRFADDIMKYRKRGYLPNKKKITPLMVKRANFVINARKFKHKNQIGGGPVSGDGKEFKVGEKVVTTKMDFWTPATGIGVVGTITDTKGSAGRAVQVRFDVGEKLMQAKSLKHFVEPAAGGGAAAAPLKEGDIVETKHSVGDDVKVPKGSIGFIKSREGSNVDIIFRQNENPSCNVCKPRCNVSSARRAANLRAVARG